MPRNVRTKSRISITILPDINEMLDQISKKTGESKSTVVENALKAFLRDKLHTDLTELSDMIFDDLPNEDEWLNIQNETR